MDFQGLLARLLDLVRWRIQNGELTERRLATRVGVSQPHMHNILKGVRALSPRMADGILRALGMSVLDLLVEERGLRESRPAPGLAGPPNRGRKRPESRFRRGQPPRDPVISW
jgi:transcriptional regulator with XRE-family HTH domain